MWYFFFARFLGLGLIDMTKFVNNELVLRNEFYEVVSRGRRRLFGGQRAGATFYVKPRDLQNRTLAQHIAVFD